MKKASLVGFLSFIGVSSAFAQTVTITSGNGTGPGQGIISLIQLIQTLIGYAGPILLSAAVLAFFYGLVMFIWKGREDEKKREGWMKFMGYSLLAIFVMVALWGIVSFIGSTLGINNPTSVNTIALPVTPKVY